MAYLLVPLKVEAAVLGADQTVIGPEMDFEALPYFDAKLGVDVNSDSPYLAETIASRPFQDESFTLEAGVHLNWDFPRFLKTGRARPQGVPEFRPVPTRWLIARYRGRDARSAAPGAPDRQWVVQSDLVLQELQGARFDRMAQTSLDVDIHSGERPYSYLGRTDDVEAWRGRGGSLPPSWTTWKQTHRDARSQEPAALTALGWGSAAFDVFYPNCHGVFGFHDPAITAVGDPAPLYVVVGWYEDAEDDCWRSYLRDRRPGREPEGLAGLDHLTEDERRRLWDESIQKALADDLGVAIPDLAELIDALPGDGMLCYGAVELAAAPATAPAAAPPKIALGNTPVEALSALIVGEGFAGLDGPASEQMEDTLSAALLGDRLKSLKTDVGPTYRAMRHDEGFAATPGGIVWQIRKSDGSQAEAEGTGPSTDAPEDPAAGTGSTTPGAPSNRRSPVPPLPEEVTPLLDRLNSAQREHDRALFALESRKSELYADWCRYMRCAYPPAEETDAFLDPGILAEWIEGGSLARCEDSARQVLPALDCEALAAAGPPDGEPSQLGARVIEAWRGLDAELTRINQSLPADARFHWILRPTPAPRFFEPASPAVVLALPRASEDGGGEGGAAGATASDGGGGESAAGATAPGGSAEGGSAPAPPDAGLLACQTFSEPLDLTPAGFEASALLRWLAARPVDPAPGASAPAGPLPGLFAAEWEVEIFPESAMHATTESSGRYDPQFILHNYSLGENAADLTDHEGLGGPVAVTPTGTLYAGRCFVNPRVGDRYGELLRGYLELAAGGAGESADPAFAAEIAAAQKFLDEHDLLAVTLNGFNSALLQRHETTQLRPADPLGFSDYQEFARRVADALPGGKAYAPDPLSEFLPIRSGALRLLSLRLVDTFGRVTEFDPQAVHRPLAMQIPDHPEWVRLPPRLSQAARLKASFLRRDGGGEAVCETLGAHSPVCGWLVPNLLDGSLDLFEADGRRAGAIDQNGKWDSDPAADPFLDRVRRWITDRKPELAAALIEALEESMDNIHPLDREGQDAYSVLMGRPMALVRLGVELELKGDPAFDLSWNELRKDLERADRETAGFDDVLFPYRLGEYRQLDDGLVGFWSLAGDGAVEPGDEVGGEGGLGPLLVSDSLSAAVEIPEGAEQQLPDWLRARNEGWSIRDGVTLLDYLRALPDRTVKRQDLIQPYVQEGGRVWDALVALGWLLPARRHDDLQHYADAGRLTLAAAAPRQEYLCLLDPFGCLHLTSGIQPVGSLRLPAGYTREALKRIEISFLTAPLLGPEALVRLSLPREPGLAWSWEELNAWPGGGASPLEQDAIRPFMPSADFPDRVVAREGRLILRQRQQGAAARQPSSDGPESTS